MAINVVAVSVDGADITRLAEFWADVLGRPVSPGTTDGFAAITISDRLRPLFHQVPEARSSRTASISISPPPTTKPKRTG